MRKLFFLLVGLCLYEGSLFAQQGAGTAPKVQEVFGDLPPDTTDRAYWQALEELQGMIIGRAPLSFKRAVFITESTYFDNTLSYKRFCGKVDSLVNLARKLTESDFLVYTQDDKAQVASYAAVFKVMTDTLAYKVADKRFAVHYPFRYDFEDIWGEQEWTQMFVTKLLITRTGNCHSLPFLYKILTEELGGKAYLAMAPNHMYIKHRCKAVGWYNTELTNPSFPVDAWVMASGYIPTEAVVSGIYMDTLSEQQSIAVCITDLANGYEKKHGVKDGKFVLEACKFALQNYPHYVNALMLKSETLKKLFEQSMQQHGAAYPKELFHNQEAKDLFSELEATYLKIHQLGYRRMPKEMYLQWLLELNTERARYSNPKMTQTLK